MKDRLQTALSKAATRLRPLGAFVRTHRFWVECASVTLFGVLAAFALGHAALVRSAALDARATELELAAANLHRWRGELRPATPAESLLWRESEATLRALGGDQARGLAVARLIARRAEEVGVEGLRVRLLGADSVASLEAEAVGAWTMEAAGEGLAVEFDGDVGDLVGFLGALPPQAAVETLSLEPRGDALAARIVLLTRRVETRE